MFEINKKLIEEQKNSIDLTIIKSFIGEDEDCIREVINLFVVHGQGTIDNISKSLTLSDYQSVVQLSHKLKSSARTSGAALLGEMAEDLQAKATAKDLISMHKLFDLIQTLMKEYVEFVADVDVTLNLSKARNLSLAETDQPAVLLVDDDPVSLKALRASIANLDVKVIEASSGKEALKLVQQPNIILVLLDIEMPDINGLNVAKSISSNPATESIPVIFITGEYGQGDYVESEYESVSIDYMLKPVNNHVVHCKVSLFINMWKQKVEVNYLLDKLKGHNVQLASEVIKRSEADQNLAYQAYHDHLTQLPNRLLALDRLSQLIFDAERSGDKVAVLFLDLDDFKKVNDSLGHEIGDKLLIQTADRLSKVVRATDTVGRLGGDEFILLLGGLNSATEVQPVAKNVLEQFHNAFNINNRDLILTASIGVAIYPDDGEEVSILLRNADSAMYHAKEAGRNTYSYFTKEMNKEVSRRLELEDQLYGALLRNEFEVFYQPKIDIHNEKIIGAEALIRWNNPELGSVSPIEFIPIAEQLNLIVPIGEYVLNHALVKTAQWGEKRAGFSMAVNLSPCQFRDPGLVDTINKIIQTSGVSASSIELEITEGVLMSGHSYIESALEEISELGIKLAMDDFGTGYSSLSYLRKFPFDILKIDQSFIRDIIDNPKDCELVNAAISMAHGLSLQVVAEGVESREHLSKLKSLHCDFAQGYLFGKPMTANAFTKLLM